MTTTRRAGRALLLALLVLAISVPAIADTVLIVANLFNTAAAANTNLLAENLTPDAPSDADPVTYQVTISLVTTASVVEWQVIRSGVTIEETLNGGSSIAAGAKFTQTFDATRLSSYNINCRTATTIGELIIVRREVR